MPIGLIVNPIAGNGAGIEAGETLANVLDEEYRKEITREKRETIEMAERLARDGFNPIIIFGGDGTTNDGVTGVFRSGNEKVIVGSVPTGRVNDFSRNIGYSKWQSFLRDFGRQQVISIDVGKVKINQDKIIYFINELGIGVDARIVEETHRRVRFPGILDYLPSLFQEIPRLKPYSLDLAFTSKEKDSFSKEKRPIILLVVANNRSYAKWLKIDPKAINDDGWFRLFCLERKLWLRDILTLATIPFGLHPKLPWVQFCEVNELTVKSKEEFILHVDGETFKEVFRCDVSLIPKGLKILAPPKAA